jgi:hypothetical protein
MKKSSAVKLLGCATQAYIERLARHRKKSDIGPASFSDIYFLDCSILDSNGSPSRRSMKFKGN